MNSRSLTCVYPETRPDVLSYCGNCVEGVGQSPDQVVIVYPCVRGYTITHPVPKSGLFFTYNCGKFTPLRLQRWEYQNYENYLAICYPSGPGLHQFRGGGFFCCLSWRTTANFWRCKLQHIKHTKLTKLTKLTIAMSSLTPPCHIGGFFRLSWLSFADGYGRLEKSAFVVLSPK